MLSVTVVDWTTKNSGASEVLVALCNVLMSSTTGSLESPWSHRHRQVVALEQAAARSFQIVKGQVDTIHTANAPKYLVSRLRRPPGSQVNGELTTGTNSVHCTGDFVYMNLVDKLIWATLHSMEQL